MGFPGNSYGKESNCDIGDWGPIPGSGRSPGEGTTTYSNILAWRIPWRKESGRLKSMGSQRVRHDWATKHIYFPFASILTHAHTHTHTHTHTLLTQGSTLAGRRGNQMSSSPGAHSPYSLIHSINVLIWGQHSQCPGPIAIKRGS